MTTLCKTQFIPDECRQLWLDRLAEETILQARRDLNHRNAYVVSSAYRFLKQAVEFMGCEDTAVEPLIVRKPVTARKSGDPLTQRRKARKVNNDQQRTSEEIR